MVHQQIELFDDNPEYDAFVDKFKPKKTTNDCYTPPEIYDALAQWVSNEYGIDRARFMRPFYPGGDYQAEEYPEGCAVVDNPPFSILAQIVDWYLARNIPFFLFAPTLTLLGLMKKPARKEKLCVILIGVPITYENGAEVQTSFVTSMDTYAVRIEAGLRSEIERINTALLKEGKKKLPKFVYPDHILTGKDYRLAKYGQTLRICHADCASVSEMDAQETKGKAIFGGGLLLSERAAAERAAAERAAAERAAAERAAAERAAAERADAVCWRLSRREWGIVQALSGGELTPEHEEEAAGIEHGQIRMEELL